MKAPQAACPGRNGVTVSGRFGPWANVAQMNVIIATI